MKPEMIEPTIKALQQFSFMLEGKKNRLRQMRIERNHFADSDGLRDYEGMTLFFAIVRTLGKNAVLDAIDIDIKLMESELDAIEWPTPAIVPQPPSLSPKEDQK